VPESLDIHRIASREEADPFADLSRTAPVRATDEDPFLVLAERRAALRALGRKRERRQLLLPLVLLDSHDVRNDLPRLLDDDDIADAYILASDLVGVVQTGSGNDRSGERNRFEFRHRSHGAGLAD